ncbi:MAG: beta-propeller domain-containing protein [Synechococcaceae cyanobacterium]|nr:beta-propeller domain-containing protein [Synechococcaceae cyanobacterium]
MGPRAASAASLALGLTLGLLTLTAPPPARPAPQGRTLRPFRSEAELAALFRRWGEEARRRRRAASRSAQGSAEPAPPPAPVAGPAEAGPADPVTNVQEAGVDEGGIVKRHGDHLVILRRGRLFTVRIGGDQLRPVAAVEAFGPGIDPSGTWYDELLIGGDTVVVIGYSYQRGGTEVGLFRIGADGRLTHRDTYQLRSNDYYSARNYASRLIGSRLIFYTPLLIRPWWEDPWSSLPAMRRWRSGTEPPPFRRIAPATRIYRTDAPLDPLAGVALHTITVCELARPRMACASTAVLGPPGREHYVSGRAAYVWTGSGWGGSRPEGAGLFRIPLDGSAPQGLRTRGAPIDAFSFREERDGTLRVLVQDDEGLALLGVPPEAFGDGSGTAAARAYRALPAVGNGSLRNRFVGGWLLVGAGAGWGRPQPRSRSRLLAVPVEGGTVQALPLAHGVDRLEALGAHGLAVGSDGRDLHLTTLRLQGTPAVADRFLRPDAAQGETRSHGFFYRAQGERSGILGLPVIAGDGPSAASPRRPPAGVLYLRNRELALSELGTLEADPRAAERDDGCRASCVDWYGNARPLFLDERVFALMGYELVEGSLRQGRLREVRRVTFAPGR